MSIQPDNLTALLVQQPSTRKLVKLAIFVYERENSRPRKMLEGKQ